MFGLLKRYRELIVVGALLVVPIGVYLSHARHPAERTGLDKAVLFLTSPVEKAVGWAARGVLRGWYGYVSLRGAREEAWQLRKASWQSALDKAELSRLREENERLRQLLAFRRESPERAVLGANVIGVRLDPKGLQLLVLDRGASDGIGRLMPVVTAQGVVGRIHAVTSGASEVLLLTDRNSSVAVRVERSRARANVRGTGSPDACRLDYALRSDDMMEGDVLVTAGTDGVFPRGLPVGRVVGLRRSGQGLYQRAEVLPAVDVRRVEEVLIVSSPESGPERPTAAQRVEPP